MDTGTCFDTVGHAESRKKAYELKFAEPSPFADPDIAARRDWSRSPAHFVPANNAGCYLSRALCTAWAFWGQSA
jgi:hypothetical protein